MNYISLIIFILILLTVAASAVIAFIIRKNWASITMLVSILLFLAFIVGQFYLQQQMSALYVSNDTEGAEYYTNLRTVMNYLGYLTVPLYITGLIGFTKSTASIHNKAITLQMENQQLSNKLNQL